MLADIRPHLNEQVGHCHRPRRDAFGQHYPADFTVHPARVVYLEGRLAAPASNERTADAQAIVWLINHPAPTAVGDIFQLPQGDPVTVTRVEYRRAAGGTLTKVILS